MLGEETCTRHLEKALDENRLNDALRWEELEQMLKEGTVGRFTVYRLISDFLRKQEEQS